MSEYTHLLREALRQFHVRVHDANRTPDKIRAIAVSNASDTLARHVKEYIDLVEPIDSMPMVLPPERGDEQGLLRIGYWCSAHPETDEERMPNPRNFVDKSWNPSTRDAVATYVEGGTIRRTARGSSRCRICGDRNGSYEQTDGTYVWPSGFSHYIRHHGVRPAADFIVHCMTPVTPVQEGAKSDGP